MVTGFVRYWLRLEGLAELALWATLFAREGGSWWIFATCFLLPDLAMLGYVAGRQWGAHVYNAAHSYVAPALLAVYSLNHTPVGLSAALIWAAHIAFDRMMGYGLKYPAAFGSTHLSSKERTPVHQA